MKPAIFCLAVLLLAGCSKNIDTPEAVKEGIIKDITGKVDVGHMDVNVDSVSFRDDGADAAVSFRPKGAPGSQAMTMNYKLERQGGEWHVKSRNMESHGQAPVQAPPLQPGQTTLPAGHMGVSGVAPMPPGHPAVPDGAPKQ